jgi:hypothetical protein
MQTRPRTESTAGTDAASVCRQQWEVGRRRAGAPATGCWRRWRTAAANIATWQTYVAFWHMQLAHAIAVWRDVRLNHCCTGAVHACIVPSRTGAQRRFAALLQVVCKHLESAAAWCMLGEVCPIEGAHLMLSAANEPAYMTVRRMQAALIAVLRTPSLALFARS